MAVVNTSMEEALGRFARYKDLPAAEKKRDSTILFNSTLDTVSAAARATSTFLAAWEGTAKPQPDTGTAPQSSTMKALSLAAGKLLAELTSASV